MNSWMNCCPHCHHQNYRLIILGGFLFQNAHIIFSCNWRVLFNCYLSHSWHGGRHGHRDLNSWNYVYIIIVLFNAIHCFLLFFLPLLCYFLRVFLNCFLVWSTAPFKFCCESWSMVKIWCAIWAFVHNQFCHSISYFCSAVIQCGFSRYRWE